MLKAFKYRIYPTKTQDRRLRQTLEECRWLYNNTLACRKAAWEEQKQQVSSVSPMRVKHCDCQNRIPSLKRLRSWLKDVYSQVLQQVTIRVDLAFQAFFKRVKAGETPGHPRFKGKGQYDSFTYTQSGFKLDGSRLHLSKIGSLWVVLHRPIEGTLKTLTIRRSTTGKWYACFTAELPEPVPTDNPESVGVDVGLLSFDTLSNGEKIDNPRFFRTEQTALVQVQRRLSKEEKGTEARRFRRKAVARVHERIRWRRENFAHQQSRRLVNQYGVICLEDLSIQNMLKNRNLAKSISDAAWHQFAQLTTRKAESAGGRVVRVNPCSTSKLCSQCGTCIEKSLSVRVHNCHACGLSLDRDWNAAINILRLGLQSLGVARATPRCDAQEARPVALCAQGRE